MGFAVVIRGGGAVVLTSVLAVMFAGCAKRAQPPAAHDAGKAGPVSLHPGDDIPVLPPAPPAPEIPAGLPRGGDPTDILGAATAGAKIALGEVLFHDRRLSVNGTLACTTCHDPAHDFSGTRQPTAAGALNLRRTPALVNLWWRRAFGWDGRYTTVADLLSVHLHGQLGLDPATAIGDLGALPEYRAQAGRVAGHPVDALTADVALDALAQFAMTRYDGDAPWDKVERAPDAPADLKAGYALFTGKAQCSVCHTPPLYTDDAYHRIGLVASHDEGRGRVDRAATGAFATPTLRGAANRTAWFHDGSAPTLDAAIDWHLAGGTGQGATAADLDPALHAIALTPAERAQLGAFVRALSVVAR